MIKPTLSNIPGMDAMTDTFDFVKNLWGGMSVPGMGLPGMVMPTLSVEEINKQISDLKAVESWLTLNMNMLRGTIQSLEVQSATISTLRSMGETLGAAVKSGGTATPAPHTPAREAAKTEEPPVQPEPAPKPAKESGSQANNSPVQQANPALWWNMLQDQFKQAVTAAMVPEPVKPTAKPDPATTKVKAAAKPRKAAAPKPRAAPKTGPKA